MQWSLPVLINFLWQHLMAKQYEDCRNISFFIWMACFSPSLMSFFIFRTMILVQSQYQKPLFSASELSDSRRLCKDVTSFLINASFSFTQEFKSHQFPQKSFVCQRLKKQNLKSLRWKHDWLSLRNAKTNFMPDPKLPNVPLSLMDTCLHSCKSRPHRFNDLCCYKCFVACKKL